MTTMLPHHDTHAATRPQGEQEADVRGCRFCDEPLTHTFVDLGKTPLCQNVLTRRQLNEMEPFYPLHAHVCGKCFLVQLHEYVSGEHIFGGDYAYFSSYSDSWLAHCKKYTEDMSERFNLGASSQVMEIASNDGYLLQYFVQRGVPALGIEPARNVAAAAEEKGVRTLVKFFGTPLARELVRDGTRPDLLLANNVLAHVPDLNDFVEGMKVVLKPTGVITVEFPHLMRLMDGNQFDTIYHEHFCYYSFLTVERVFAAHGLTIFDVQELPTHGGSLRIFAGHSDARQPMDSVLEMRRREREYGIERLETYRTFAHRVEDTKAKLLTFLIEAKRAGKTVVGYGAPGKGNTLLNYCGIRTDLLAYTVDRNPYKQGKFTPGTHIPIHAPEKIAETKPDYVLILPWNLKDEIAGQLAYIREWGGRCVVPVPQAMVVE